MRCPRCDDELWSTTIERAPVGACSKCGGIWLAGADVVRVSGPGRAIAWVPSEPTGEDTPLRCPQCDDDVPVAYREAASRPLLRRITTPDDRTLMLDRCEHCDGIWLDSGELDRLSTSRVRPPPDPAAPEGGFLSWVMRAARRDRS